MKHDPHEYDHLRLHHDPEHAQMELLLDGLAQQDQDAAPDGLESRVLDEISRIVVPAPIALVPRVERDSPGRLWSIRAAAAMVLVTGTTLVIVGTEPWSISPESTDNHEITLASLTEDLDEYFSLESMEHENITQAITDWELWAQTIDADLSADSSYLDLTDITYEDGAL